MRFASTIRTLRVVVFFLLCWNIEEVFRSFENNWDYHFFFWNVGKDYWFWWCLLGGVAMGLYVWAEIEVRKLERLKCPLGRDSS